ncbi:hypothetical protein M6G53_07745 [Serratia nevei]|uniref:hypothetical protein n=1 Tax=Serratia nevei TaxID=2703794 RepID=UPI0020A19F21|nr:hypothetical protein [Serratia nevei]MCP1105295.1 hypothetical protein [Serratia nevei]
MQAAPRLEKARQKFFDRAGLGRNLPLTRDVPPPGVVRGARKVPCVECAALLLAFLIIIEVTLFLISMIMVFYLSWK